MLGKERRAYLLLRKDITYFFLLLKFYTKVEIDKVLKLLLPSVFFTLQYRKISVKPYSGWVLRGKTIETGERVNFHPPFLLKDIWKS